MVNRELSVKVKLWIYVATLTYESQAVNSDPKNEITDTSGGNELMVNGLVLRDKVVILRWSTQPHRKDPVGMV